MAKVFLSYAREDTARVRPLAQALESSGHSVWWDQRIAGGDQFNQAIEDALDSADVVVAVWTEAANRSPWVRDEAAAGRDRGILVPVCLGRCVPPLGFRQFQTIDLSGWNGRASSKALTPLKEAVAARVAGATGADAARHSSHAGRWRWLERPRWIAAAVALLLIAAAGILIPRIGAIASSDSVTPKVALGEFAVLSPELPPGMSRALHDEIMAAFGAENAVAVTAARGGAGQEPAPFLLDGSIRMTGDSLRLNVNLTDSDSGTVLWSRAFDRAAADPLAARQVAVGASEVVRCALWGAASYPRRMPEEALIAYLQFCDEHWVGSPDDQRMLDAARRVTVALPDFSFGWSALALSAVSLGQGSGPEATAIRQEAFAAARRATELDDLNPEGYMAEALLLPTERFAEREALLKKAISVRPTECGCERTAYGDFLTSVGRFEEAVEQYERAQALRPLSPGISVRLAQALYVTGRESEAERAISDMLEIWPDSISLRLLKLKSALWTRRYGEALAMLNEPGLHLTNAQVEALSAAFEALRSGSASERSAAAGQLAAMARDPRRNDRLVIAALAAIGESDVALDAARRLVRERGHMSADVLFEPNLAAAGATSGYDQLVRQLGLAAYWRSTRNLPDICRGAAKLEYCVTA